MGFFEKLKNGLKKTKDSMMGRIEKSASFIQQNR